VRFPLLRLVISSAAPGLNNDLCALTSAFEHLEALNARIRKASISVSKSALTRKTTF
jgi:hypothetical protein